MTTGLAKAFAAAAAVVLVILDALAREGFRLGALPPVRLPWVFFSLALGALALAKPAPPGPR